MPQPRRRPAVLVRLILALAALVLPRVSPPARSGRAAAAAPLAAGQTYVVNSLLDAPDADQGDGVCLTAQGTCTLRAAVMQANFAADPNTITVPAGVYLLTRVGFDAHAVVGDLDVTHDLTLIGAGAGATILDGNGAATGDRVIEVLDTAFTVSLSDLTLRHGVAPTATLPSLLGGGLYRDGGSGPYSTRTLQLTHVILEGNSAEDGGGLYVAGGLAALDHTQFYANAATNAGGGLAARGSGLTLRDSQVYSNTAYDGGGVALIDVTDGLIERTTIYSNTTSAYGGGLLNLSTNSSVASTVTLLDSYLHHNHAAEQGGAIHNGSALTLRRTVLDANSAGLYGGGLVINTTYGPSPMLIDQSTLSHNTAQSGGAIYDYDSNIPGRSLTIVNSTLSGNTVSHDGGGLYASGGARVTLANVTIANNRLVRPTGQVYAVHGGGVLITNTAVLTTHNTLLADNLFLSGLALPQPNDCFGPLQSQGYNLIEDLNNCALSGPTTGNLTGQDPLLGPLQYQGGLTPTHALLPGSPALNAGDPAGCTQAGGAPLTTDQRGWQRQYGAQCDLGALEVSPYFGLYVPLVSR